MKTGKKKTRKVKDSDKPVTGRDLAAQHKADEALKAAKADPLGLNGGDKIDFETAPEEPKAELVLALECDDCVSTQMVHKGAMIDVQRARLVMAEDNFEVPQCTIAFSVRKPGPFRRGKRYEMMISEIKGS